MMSISTAATAACLFGWALSYFNWSYSSQLRAYGFSGGAFCWNSCTPGRNVWNTSDWVPRALVESRLRSPFDDGMGYSIVLKEGVGRKWLHRWDPGQRCVRIDNRWTFYGFVDFETYWIPRARGNLIIVPFWLPTIFFGMVLLCGQAWRLFARDRRRAEGRCLACGYDLTGNVTGVCSECGQQVERGDASNAVEPTPPPA